MEQNREQTLLQTVGTLLDIGDLPRVLAVLRNRFPRHELREMIHSTDPRVRCAAIRCLGLVGRMDDCEPLVLLLSLAEAETTALVEDTLWSIWMRAGSDTAQARLAEAIASDPALGPEHTARQCAAIVADEPAYAEAHHQLAIALHAAGNHAAAEQAYAEALERNPWHFAAAAGLGHVRVELGDFPGALDAYRRALRIHPGLEELGELVPQLESALHRRDVA